MCVSTVCENTHRHMPESKFKFYRKVVFSIAEQKTNKQKTQGLLDRQKMMFSSLTFKSNNLLSPYYCSEVVQRYQTRTELSGLCYEWVYCCLSKEMLVLKV